MAVMVPEHVRIRQYLVGLIAAAPTGETLQRIPPERELCKVFKTSRSTLRKTLEQLENEGFLIRKPHFGTYINNEYRSRLNYFTQKHKIVGIVIGDGQTTFYTAYYMKMLARIFDCLAAQEDYNGRLLSLNGNPEEELDIMLDSHQFDGMIFITPLPCLKNCIRTIKSHGIPLVIVHFIRPDEDCHAVYSDYYQSHFRIVEHLLRSGHRDILFLEENIESIVVRKKAGAMDAFAAAGLAWNEKLWHQEMPVRAAELVDNICRYGAKFTAACVSEAFYCLLQERQPEIPIIRIAVTIRPDYDGFQVIAPANELGDAGGKMMVDLLNAPGNSISTRRIAVDYEIISPLTK